MEKERERKKERERERQILKVKSQLDFNLAHFPFLPHIRTATFDAIFLSQSH